ncbi:BA75_04416T0 [Komagataella pastoris]|uniref:BA75_04416T0 n=1 Tax=Komagataella pastoris TaxID=4922 RepID=A0A1B2JIV0_PICPA|nr:BA75_04416T0 [Komagataella pastoris]
MFHQQDEYRVVCYELEQFLAETNLGQNHGCVDEFDASYVKLDFKSVATTCVLSSFCNMLDFRRTVKQTQSPKLNIGVQQMSLGDNEMDCQLRGIQGDEASNDSAGILVDINDLLGDNLSMIQGPNTQTRSKFEVQTLNPFDGSLRSLYHESKDESFLIHSDEEALDISPDQCRVSSREERDTVTAPFALGKERPLSISPRRVCKPLSKEKIFSKLVKPALKIPKKSLNLFVDSADGRLDEATKYATEINSLNAECIPLPENTNETVTIPAAHAAPSEKRGAIVRAALPMRLSSKLAQTQGQKQGFYTIHQFRDYLREKGFDGTSLPEFETESDNKENINNRERFVKMRDLKLINIKQSKNEILKKSVKWAIDLEW